MNIATLATVVGIGVGCIAILKGSFEVFERIGRRRIAVERGLTDAPDIGNSVTIVNMSDKPLMISAWDIVWARWRPWGHKITNCAFEGDEDSRGLTVNPHARERFDFFDEHHFPVNAKMQSRYGKLYFRLWISGARRAKWFRLI